jgi:hypothetical protein
MKKRQMRMGMFDHAKYSRPVIRGMPDELIQDVSEQQILIESLQIASMIHHPNSKLTDFRCGRKSERC